MSKRKKNRMGFHLPKVIATPPKEYDQTHFSPKIENYCEELNDTKITKLIKSRLRFANPEEIRLLSRIKILPRIESQYGETSGLYHYASSKNLAEIDLSQNLFVKKGFLIDFIKWVSNRDFLFETLFHEIGHHHATLIHSIGKYQNEAYAEKYMLEYYKKWQERKASLRILKRILRKLIYIFLTITMKVYQLKHKNTKYSELIDKMRKREISCEELREDIDKISGTNRSIKTKKLHPLNKSAYLKRFKIENRFKNNKNND
jgi:hypothetical protein